MSAARAVALAVLGCSCASLSSMQTASTMGKGNFQGGVEGVGMGVSVPGSTAQYIPTVNGFFRFGVTDHVDLGFRGGGTVLELQGKFMFTDPDFRVPISLAPALSGYYLWATTGNGTTTKMSTPANGRLSLAVPLLVGIKFGDHELVFGARETNHLLFQRPVAAPQLLNSGLQIDLGGSAGFAIRLGNSFILMPEVAFEIPVYSTAPNLGGFITTFGPGSVNVTAGVAAIFGRMKPRSAAAAQPAPEIERWEERRPPPPLPADVAPPPPPPPLPPPAGL